VPQSTSMLFRYAGRTAASVADTQPVIDQVKLSWVKDACHYGSAIRSLEAAAVQWCDSAIKSLDSFRSVMSGVPLLAPSWMRRGIIRPRRPGGRITG
jgi:hypothetical protein